MKRIGRKYSQLFDKCLNFVMLAGLFGGVISVVNVNSAATSTGSVVNGSLIASPSSAFDWSVLGSLAPYLTFIIAGLVWLYKRWKDRSWKDKYDNVVVAKDPF